MWITFDTCILERFDKRSKQISSSFAMESWWISTSPVSKLGTCELRGTVLPCPLRAWRRLCLNGLLCSYINPLFLPVDHSSLPPSFILSQFPRPFCPSSHHDRRSHPLGPLPPARPPRNGCARSFHYSYLLTNTHLIGRSVCKIITTAYYD
jgi:hypothetical protein